MRQLWTLRPATCATLGLVSCVIAWASVQAEGHGLPYRPAQDDQVVLAAAPGRDPEAGERARLRAALRARPHDETLALRLARAELTRARQSGDVRPLGRAEALLAPFAERPSAELLVLRATLAQARHEFARALQDLERALELAPDDAQARLTQAALLTVLGRYPEARASCDALAGIAPAYVSLLCRANLDGYTGARAQALRVLAAAAARLPERSARAWAGSLLCEHAFWGGELAQAEQACAGVLALDPTDRYTRALYLDVLLEAGKAEQALAQAPSDTEDDALLLRRALAARALNRPESAELVAKLEQRFARSRARGDRLHQREEARLLLALGREPDRALLLARRGFEAQRELWDVRVLLAAAAQAKDPAAAEPALAFLRANKLGANLLEPLLRRIGGAS